MGWCDVLLKHYCFTAGHHFDEYRKLNIKNPLFVANGGFFVFGEFVGERDSAENLIDGADGVQSFR